MSEQMASQDPSGTTGTWGAGPDGSGDDGADTWLVGSDGSDDARRALEWAATMAAGRNATLRLVTAWQHPYIGIFPMAGSSVPVVDPDLEELIHKELDELAADVAEQRGARIVTSTANGPASQVLLELVEDASLAVVGSRGRGGFARLVLGSVSHQLASHSSRPTIVVPPEAEARGLSRVVVGFDGSPNAIAALTWAHRFVPAECAIVVVHSWDPPYGAYDSLDADALRTLRSEAEGAFRSAISDTAASLDAPDRFEVVAALGHPGQRLVEHAESADLLVVGARGRSGLMGTILGSVSTFVVHHLVCPTAIVPDVDTEDPLGTTGRRR